MNLVIEPILLIGKETRKGIEQPWVQIKWAYTNTQIMLVKKVQLFVNDYRLMIYWYVDK